MMKDRFGAGDADALRLQLARLKDSSTMIVVEGKKDKISLEKIGVDAERITTLNKRPLYAVVEELAMGNNKEVILLTDLDHEGKKIFGTLNAGFSRFGIKVNTTLRNFLLKNTKLRQIEGLYHYTKRIETTETGVGQ